jgi:hypothetical protein
MNTNSQCKWKKILETPFGGKTYSAPDFTISFPHSGEKIKHPKHTGASIKQAFV